jgi:NAD(P) transhydrogenase
MSIKTYDLIVIGSGPAGFSSVMQASKFGKKVLLVEAHPQQLGGAWINTGTVPSKALRDAAMNIHKFTQQFGDLGGKKAYDLFQMKDLLKFKTQVIDHENSEIKRNLIKNEVDTARGFGRIVDANTVEVTDQLGKAKTYKADFILVSTGSKPRQPELFEVNQKTILDVNALMNLTHIPRRLTIVGTGINAIEYATIFNALGTKVSILNLNKDFLTFLDEEIRTEFLNILEAKRINVKSDVKLKGISFNLLRNYTEVRYTLGNSDELMVLESEQVLYFGKRIPNTAKIGLDNVGIKTDRSGYIKVDEHFRTTVPNIFAAGDVIGYPGLASASFNQGRLACCEMFGIPTSKVSSDVPFGIYSIPEIASVGLNEEEARANGYEVTLGRSYYNSLTKAAINNNKSGLLKLVFETSSFRLLGVQIVGDEACEVIHLGQAVMAKGGDIRYFINHILNYPTYSEAYRVAAFNGVNRVFKAGVKYRKLLEDTPIAD